MKSIVVISDTHGNIPRLTQIQQVLAESDYIIHLGDTSGDGSRITRDFGSKTILINGNCDFSRLGDDERVLEIEGVKIFATHGHLYSVKTTLTKLKDRAKELGCAIALYGHTHVAREDEIDGVTLVCPGNMCRYSQNSYCYLVINGNKFTSKIVPLNQTY